MYKVFPLKPLPLTQMFSDSSTQSVFLLGSPFSCHCLVIPPFPANQLTSWFRDGATWPCKRPFIYFIDESPVQVSWISLLFHFWIPVSVHTIIHYRCNFVVRDMWFYYARVIHCPLAMFFVYVLKELSLREWLVMEQSKDADTSTAAVLPLALGFMVCLHVVES